MTRAEREAARAELRAIAADLAVTRDPWQRRSLARRRRRLLDLLAAA